MIPILSFSAAFRVVQERLERSLYTEITYTRHDTTVLDTPGLSLTEDMDNPCKFVNRITAVAQPTSYRVITLDNIFII